MSWYSSCTQAQLKPALAPKLEKLLERAGISTNFIDEMMKAPFHSYDPNILQVGKGDKGIRRINTSDCLPHNTS
jgi:hypothetical protein